MNTVSLNINDKFDMDIIVKHKEIFEVEKIIRDNELSFTKCILTGGTDLWQFTVYGCTMQTGAVMKLVLKTAGVKTY